MTHVIARVPRGTFPAHIVEELRKSIVKGLLPLGSQLNETRLADQFGVSRGPLREAMRQLIAEGFLVSVPYTGTSVINLSVADAREIYSLRTTLETFAAELAWDKRTREFRREIERRNEVLAAAIDSNDSFATSEAEVRVHGMLYEWSGHKQLQQIWRSLSGRLQIYLAVHQRAHGRTGPLADAHRRYVQLAKGDDLDAMISEIRNHMRRGVTQLEMFLASEQTKDSRRDSDGRAL